MTFGVEGALAVVSLVVAIKTTLDACLWLDDLLRNDNHNAHGLVLQFKLENVKLGRWKAALEESKRAGEDPIVNLPPAVKNLMHGYLVEVQSLSFKLNEGFERHGMSDIPDYGVNSTVAGSKELTQSVPLKDEALRRSFRPRRILRYKIKDEKELEGILKRYRKAIEGLDSLLSHAMSLQPTESAALGLFFSKLRAEPDLRLLARAATTYGTLWSNCADLKLRDMGVTLPDAPHISKDELKPDHDLGPSTARTMGWYASQRVFIEWKRLDPGLSDDHREKLMSRAEALAALLCQRKGAEFRIPSCLGICTIPGREHGFVYRLPSHKSETLGWYTLADRLAPMRDPGGRRMIKKSPLLGDRFRLARSLASVFNLLHSCHWLHKDFQSGNVLFFEREGLNQQNERINISEMYVTGFQYSRPDGDESFDGPGDSLYRHPNASQGFTRQCDWYSLGVVLFEIALWESMPATLGTAGSKFSSKAKKQWMLDSLGVLGGKVGKVYREVVRFCLNGDPGEVVDPNDEEELAKQFLVKVLDPLHSCKA